MKQRNRLAIILGLVVVMVLTGSGVASALWLAQITATSTVKAANLDDACSNVTSVVNASFEEPVIADFSGAPSINQTPDSLVPGWVSTPENIIEIWNQNNFMGLAPPVGNQFVELNATYAGTLSQSISTTPGQVLQWSLLHRGRAGVDTMDVLIGPAGGTQVSQGNISDGTAAWVRYSGAYVVPAGQTMTQISFRAVSTATGDQSVGNFLDDVSFGSGPCLEVTSVVNNVTNPGGTVRAGDQLEYVTTVKNTGSSPSFGTILTNTVPSTLTYTANSIRIGTTTGNTTARTDANDADTAKAASGVLTAYLGTTATGTAGGSIAQGTQVVYRWLATAPTASPNATTVAYAPSVSYVNNLAPNWTETATAPNVPVTIYNGSDIRVQNNVTPTPAAGASGTWTFALANIGNATSSAVTTTRITAPAGVTLTAVTRNTTNTGVVTTACTVVTVGSVYDCAFGALTATSTRAINATGLVAAGTAAGTTLAVTALSTSANDYNAANNLATNTATVRDTTAPSAPTNLTASEQSTTGAKLTWTASTDNIGVTGYRIYRNGTLIATTSGAGTSYTATGGSGLTVYTYGVTAIDAAGNESLQSAPAYALTKPDLTANYELVNNRTNGKCLATTTSTTGAVSTATCGLGLPASLQDWRFVSSGADTYHVASVYSTTRTWDIVPDAGSYTSNYRVIRAANVTETAQNNWVPRLAPDNVSIEFYNPNSGRCLDINGAVTTAGVQLQIYDCNGSDAQKFAATKTN